MATLRLASLGAALWLAAAAVHAAPVAFVSDVQGDARLAAGGKLAFLAELEPATQLLLEKDARAVVIYTASGAEFTLNGPATFVVEAAEVKAVKGGAAVRRVVTNKAEPALVARHAQAASASVRMRSVAPPPAPLAPPSRPALLYPREGAIATLQPLLQWSAPPLTAGFSVAVLDAAGQEVWRGKSKGQSVKVGRKLASGKAYSWVLFGGGATLGEQRFETLPETALKRVQASQSAAATFPDRVLHALVLQDVGAAQDARRAWSALSRERPDLAELALLAR